MSDQRRKALKTILQLTCQLLWVVGLVVCLSGVYLLMNYRQNTLFLSHSYISLPAILALASAALLYACGCIGSWLSLRDSTFLQGLLDSALSPLSGVFQNYTGSSQDPNSQAVDATQAELQCCGVKDYRDWKETSWFNSTGGLWVPHSCCNSTFPSCDGTVYQPQQLYTQGCQVKLEMSLQFVLSLIIWGFPLVFLVEVVLFLTMAQLMKDQPRVEYRVLDIN
ncbi:tetraspanin 37 isoform X2 [Cottoperca gobio]|uniref:Tetraspanin 37 isoform X2 n=1 Tax=Cottoperca gobio TaxID=56716 RepID=A0A6J2P8X5_COTGO|nr:tetraspanin-3-like isoform X2 [Cottoperca gobio]